eukprot:10029984-Alexandrium_andersonii.AAC.1
MHIRKWIERALRAADWQEEHGRLTATRQVVADLFRHDPDCGGGNPLDNVIDINVTAAAESG